MEETVPAKHIIEANNRPSQLGKKRLSYKAIFDAAADGLVIIKIESGEVIDANSMACWMFGFQHYELIGKPFQDLIEPEDKEKFRMFIEAVKAKHVSEIVIRRCYKDGSILSFEVKGTQTVFGGELCVLGSFHNVSHWVSAENEYRNQAEIYARERSTLLDISQTLASSLKLKPGIVLEELRVVIEYSHAIRFELNDDSLVAVFARGSEALEQSLPFTISLLDSRLTTHLFNQRYPTLIAEIWQDEPEANSLRAVVEDKRSVVLEGMHSWMWVPISYKERLLGGLGVAHSKNGFYTAHDADLALTVANQAAIAIANAELYSHAQTLAALQERQRLARDLHDAVNQSLFSAGLIAEVLPRQWEKDPIAARESVENLRRLMLGAQADMRLLLAELRPNALIDANFGDLLRQLGKSLTGRTRIPVSIIVRGEQALPGDVQLAFYRLCQEAFNNIARHADAKKVEVLFTVEKDSADLQITDDGSGFDPEQIPPGHYGVHMMQERAEDAGALLSVISQIGKGTQIIIHWPGNLTGK